MRDPRYIRVGGRLVLVIYKPSQIPDLARMAAVWREEALRQGVGKLHLVAVQHGPADDHRSMGFDRNLEFAPHGIDQLVLTGAFGLQGKGFTDSVYDYQSTAGPAEEKRDLMRFRYAMLGWDNTARVGSRVTSMPTCPSKPTAAG